MSVLVYANSSDGKLKKSAFEVVSYGKKVAEELGTKLIALTINANDVIELQNYGADNAIRINADPKDGMSVAKEIAVVAKEGGYDLILAGKESSDYNGQMVPGMLAALLDYNFINGCVQIDVDGTNVSATREIDGGSESLKTNLPLVVGGQKGIVEESDLRIPNMRGIMMARKKPLQVLESSNSNHATNSVSFEKPAPKGAVKLVDAENIDELINLLHNEAKVI